MEMKLLGVVPRHGDLHRIDGYLGRRRNLEQEPAVWDHRRDHGGLRGAADRGGAGSCNPVGSYPLRPLQPSRPYRLQTDRARCHVNWVVLDGDSEAEFCRVAEAHPIR